MKRQIPNILTGARLVLCVLVFAALVTASAALNLRPDSFAQAAAYRVVIGQLGWFAAIGFIVAAVTDFFDGWLARKWNVVSTFGAIMDPIADKVLVCGAIMGLVGLGMPGVLVPGAIILFREFSVSAMRETLAPKGLKLPVTFLAKTKTAIQLVALAGFLVMFALATQIEGDDAIYQKVLLGIRILFWLAAIITVWTGLEYGFAARKALKAAAAPEPEPATKPATRRRSAKPE